MRATRDGCSPALPSLLGAAAALLAGCSAGVREPQIERRGEYRVSVSAAGHEVRDYEQQLVHRIVLTPSDVEPLLAGYRGLPFAVVPVDVAAAGAAGLRVAAITDRQRAARLGVQLGDVLTSLDRRPLLVPKGLAVLGPELDENRRASLSLLRAGKPQKILYVVESGERGGIDAPGAGR